MLFFLLESSPILRGFSLEPLEKRPLHPPRTYENLRVKTPSSSIPLLNLLQCYEAEFSAITEKLPNELGEFPLDIKLDGSYDAYLFTENKIPIGFAIKGTESGLHDISEFYVIPSKRHNSLGRTFAKEIFKKYIGPWQVRQIEGADLAVRFWTKAISEFTNGDFTSSKEEDDYWGKITIQRFEVSGNETAS